MKSRTQFSLAQLFMVIFVLACFCADFRCQQQRRREPSAAQYQPILVVPARDYASQAGQRLLTVCRSQFTPAQPFLSADCDDAVPPYWVISQDRSRLQTQLHAQLTPAEPLIAENR